MVVDALRPYMPPPWLLAFALPVLLTLLAIGVGRGVGPEEDPERARFMLECSYDWGLAPAECRALLRGDDPPPLPAEPGC